MPELIATHPSIRWRRRTGSSPSAPPPRRWSSISVVSITSVDSSSSLDEDDVQIDSTSTSRRTLGGAFSLRNLLSFDAFTLRSTAWRKERMLTSTNAESNGEVSYIPHYGHNVCFIPQQFHYTVMELEPYRKIGDPEMDVLLNFCGCGAFDDVIAYASKEYQNGTQSPSSRFYKHYHDHIPDWVDFDQIQRGIDVFLAYLPVAGCALFYRSLVGGFSIPQIVQVLIATRYLVPSHLAKGSDSSLRSEASTNRDRKRSEERLIDTGGFLACCFAPLVSIDSDEKVPAAASLRPGGKGWEAALSVRVLHAKVRRSLLQSKKAGSGWDVERDGIPINQEDLAATLLAFSVNVLLGIETVAGRPLPESEQRDYLALWRYLGWLLGVDTVETEDGQFKSSNARTHNPLIPIDPCGPRKLSKVDDQGRLGSLDVETTEIDPANDSIIHSYATLESMILHLLHPEESSRELVRHLLSLKSFVMFRSEVCRKFLGDPLSDDLGISKSSMNWRGWRKEAFYNFVSHVGVKFFLYLFLLFLRWYTKMSMSSPWIRSRAIVWHAKLEGKFLRVWEKMHSKRMLNAAPATQNTATAKSSSKNSYCPFAMVMAPSL